MMSHVIRLLLLFVILLAFCLRIFHLDTQSIWIDEAWTIHFIRLPVSKLWQTLHTSEIHPPLYFTPLHFWRLLTGESEFALRYYSLFWSVIAVAFSFVFATALGGRRLGLLTMALMAVAPYQVWHAQDARMYSSLTAAALLSMIGFIHGIQSNRWHWWGVYVIGTLWSLLTHYHGVFVVGVQGLFCLLTLPHHWSTPRRSHYLRWAGSLFFVVLCFAPWVWFTWGFITQQSGWLTQPTLGATYLRGLLAYSLGELTSWPLALWLTLPFAFCFVMGIAQIGRRSLMRWSKADTLTFFAVYLFVPNFIAWFYGELRSTIYFERYLITLQVGFLTVVANGIVWLFDYLQRWGRTWGRSLAWVGGGIGIALLLSINSWVLRNHYFDPSYSKEDWRAVAAMIDAYAIPGDAVILTGDGGEKAFAYYQRGTTPVFTSFNTPVPSNDQAIVMIQKIASTHDRIWYSPYGVQIDPLLRDWLRHNTYPAWNGWLGKKQLALYGTFVAGVLTNKGDGPDFHPIDFRNDAASGLRLLKVSQPKPPLVAGELLPLELTLQNLAAQPAMYQLSLRLLNQADVRYEQSDWPPLIVAEGIHSWQPQETVNERRSVWIPADAPPGQYKLEAVVYDPRSGKSFGEPTSLFTFTVEPTVRIVPPEALHLPNRTDLPLGALSVVGCQLPQSTRPGEKFLVWLYLQARQTPLEPKMWQLQVGEPSPTNTLWPLSKDNSEFAVWPMGQVRRVAVEAFVDLQNQADQVSVRLVETDGAQKTNVELGMIAVIKRQRIFDKPSVQVESQALFGNPALIGLVGYDVPDQLKAGEPLPVTLYWQANQSMPVNYTVFVQLLTINPTGGLAVIAQIDREPQAGAARTSAWQTGETIIDTLQVALPSALASGDYQLIAGLYDASSGQRLPVSTGGDYVRLSEFTIH